MALKDWKKVGNEYKKYYSKNSLDRIDVFKKNDFYRAILYPSNFGGFRVISQDKSKTQVIKEIKQYMRTH